MRDPKNTDLFQRRVDDVVNDWLGSKRTQDRLERVAFMLGLRHVAYTNGWRVVPEHSMVSEREPIVIGALLTLLHRHDPSCLLAQPMESVILGGLLRRDRWRACFKTEKSAYDFAVLAARFFDRGETVSSRDEDNDQFKATNRDFDTAVGNEPNTSMTAPLRAKAFLRTLFGNAWADIMITGEKGASLADLIATTRPPFLPGLLPARYSVLHAVLPDLECS